jgi:hypothetical protein
MIRLEHIKLIIAGQEMLDIDTRCMLNGYKRQKKEPRVFTITSTPNGMRIKQLKM